MGGNITIKSPYSIRGNGRTLLGMGNSALCSAMAAHMTISVRCFSAETACERNTL